MNEKLTEKKSLRVGFMGTPDFSVSALRAIHESSHDVVCVYSQPPRPKGRGHAVQPSPVHVYAETHTIPVFTPTSLKTPDAQAQFAAQNLDVAIVVAYGLILPKAILDTPKHGCINIHASLLPRWRGASPIQQSIWADDTQTGVSIMQMDEGLDTGPVIDMQKIPLTETTTASALHDDLSALGANMVVRALDKLAEDGALNADPQGEDTTYAPLLKKEDGAVNWALRANSIDCQIRALNPWPGVRTDLNGKIIKILGAARTDLQSDAPKGAILDRDGHIVCGDKTVIQLTKIQPHNAKAMDFTSAINGGHVAVGDVFS